MASTSLRRSSSSDWRAISSKLARNSDAMPRSLAMNWPNRRSSTGRSFGPTTINATMAMTMSSVMPTSGSMGRWPNEKRRPHQGGRRGLPLQCALSAARAVFLVLGKRLLGLVGRLFALQAVAEGADALGGVAHKAGDLAAAAEQQRRRDDDRKDVPDAKGAHALNSPWAGPLRRTPVLSRRI